MQIRIFSTIKPNYCKYQSRQHSVLVRSERSNFKDVFRNWAAYFKNKFYSNLDRDFPRQAKLDSSNTTMMWFQLHIDYYQPCMQVYPWAPSLIFFARTWGIVLKFSVLSNSQTECSVVSLYALHNITSRDLLCTLYHLNKFCNFCLICLDFVLEEFSSYILFSNLQSKTVISKNFKPRHVKWPVARQHLV